MEYAKIEEIVKSKGWTLGGLAEKIGVTRAGFYKTLEKNTLKVETLEKIAQVLDVPVCEFFGEHDDDLDSIPLMRNILTTQSELLILAMHILYNARTTSFRLYESVLSFRKALEDEKQASCFNHPAGKDLSKLIDMLSESGKLHETEEAITKLSEMYMNTAERKNEFLQSLEKNKH